MSQSVTSFDAEHLVALGRVGDVVPAPDGTWAAVTVERLDDKGARYVSDLWRVPLAGDAQPTQLTVGEWRDRAPCFRVDGALGFLSDRPVQPPAGPTPREERLSQVWLMPACGAEPRPVTDEPLGVASFRFAVAADRLVVVAPVLPGVPHEEQREVSQDRRKHGPSILRYTAMPVRFWDHWLPRTEARLIGYDGSGEGRRDLTPDAGGALRDLDWDLSADGARVVATWETMNPADRIFDQALALIDTDTGARRLVGEGPGISHEAPTFAPDGRSLACTRNTRTPQGYGAVTLWRFDQSDSWAGRELTGAWDRWPQPQTWTADGARVVVTADDQGYVPIFAVDAATGDVQRLIAAGVGGAHTGVRCVPGTDLICGARHGRMAAPEPFVMPLPAPGGLGETPLVVGHLSGLSEERAAAFCVQRDVTVDVGDGRRVQTFIVEPRVRPAGPKRAYLWIHGGPVSVWADVWHWRWNPLILVAAGYTVVLPNPAGSTGFGQDWIEGIWGNVWGARCYDDLMAVTDALEADGTLERGETVAMGGSFGGYMTNWIGANTDRFKALVTHASVFSMSGFHGVTDLPSWWSLMMGSTPFPDRDAFDRYSPAMGIAAWKTPTLILHGEKDYRVPIGESLALFEGLQHHGVPSELVVFPDENHWIMKPRNIVAWYGAFLDFVAQQSGR